MLFHLKLSSEKVARSKLASFCALSRLSSLSYWPTDSIRQSRFPKIHLVSLKVRALINRRMTWKRERILSISYLLNRFYLLNPHFISTNRYPEPHGRVGLSLGSFQKNFWQNHGNALLWLASSNLRSYVSQEVDYSIFEFKDFSASRLSCYFIIIHSEFLLSIFQWNWREWLYSMRWNIIMYSSGSLKSLKQLLKF